MAQTQVKVIDVFEQHIRVSGQRTGGCSACAQRAHCGVQASELSSNKSFTLELPYDPLATGTVTPGEILTLGCDEKHLFKAILTLFGPPLIGLVLLPLLWMLCVSPPASDLSIFICAVLGTLLGLGFSRFLARQFRPLTDLSVTTMSLVTKPTKPV